MTNEKFMNNIIISPRLIKVAQMISHSKVADIGTDHGKLLIYLSQKNHLDLGIGSDINQGPAESCRQNILKYGLNDKIEIRVGDGLKTIKNGEVDSIVIAGMGGELILKILEESLQTAKSVSEIILQPMTNISKLLESLNRLNFKISDACLVEEKDKLYQIFRIQDGVENYVRPVDLIISPLYKQNNDPLLSELLKREILKAKNKLDGLKKSDNVDEDEILSTEKLLKELENYEN